MSPDQEKNRGKKTKKRQEKKDTKVCKKKKTAKNTNGRLIRVSERERERERERVYVCPFVAAPMSATQPSVRAKFTSALPFVTNASCDQKTKIDVRVSIHMRPTTTRKNTKKKKAHVCVGVHMKKYNALMMHSILYYSAHYVFFFEIVVN